MILAAGSASAETAIGIGNFDWRPVMDAIMHVESKGNAKAVNGPHAGILQISKGIVTECNSILKSKGSKKRYTLADRFSPNDPQVGAVTIVPPAAFSSLTASA